MFVFIAIVAMIGADDIPPRDLLSVKPAWFFAAVLFLVFSLVLLASLLRILQTQFVLEFSENAIIDRRLRRKREIPYSLIEIFSPKPEELFSVSPELAEVREKLGIEEYVSIGCRLRSGRAQDVESVTDDFVFFEKVETPTFEMQALIVARLKSKIARFEQLETDDGAGFGDEETNY